MAANLVLVLDKAVSTEAEVTALGIRCGDIVAIEPNFMFADDELCREPVTLTTRPASPCLWPWPRLRLKKKLTPARHTWVHIAVTEETGMGAAYGLPEDIHRVYCPGYRLRRTGTVLERAQGVHLRPRRPLGL